MKERSFDEMIAYFNCRVADMDISQDCKMELLGMVTALGYKHEKSAQQWIPCSERLPEEDGQYLIMVKYKHVNDSYEDVYAEHGEWFDGRWDMFCFGHCGEVEDIIAWMPLPEPWKGEKQ